MDSVQQGITEIYKDVYQIKISLKNSPLKELNSYLFYSKDNCLLVDTGFRTNECFLSMKYALKKLNVNMDSLDIMLTHAHSDHSGLADKLVGDDRCIYISKKDFGIIKDTKTRCLCEKVDKRYIDEGFPQSEIDYINNGTSLRKMMPDICKENVRFISNGDEIHVGDNCLRIIDAPGHTPGQICFWIEKYKAIFTSDHVLFDISPNICMWPGVNDSLKTYLDNLRSIDLFGPDAAWPGHRGSGDFHSRIQELLKHHKNRLEEICEIINNNPGISAYECAAKMSWNIRGNFWENYPVQQKYFAVGETISHLDYLCNCKKLKKQMKNYIYRYYTKG